MQTSLSQHVFRALSVMLCVFVMVEVNYPLLTPQGDLAIFSLLGLTLVFLKYPLHKTLQQTRLNDVFTGIWLLLSAGVFGYIIMQNEPLFADLWVSDQPLGDRAGAERPLDYWVGLVGLLVVLESARRAIGWTLPLLALAFISYAAFGTAMPDWFFPHRGYGWERIVSQAFLHSQGVFGIALRVMFTYVFLFVLFGTLLSQTGATDFIINFARRIFRNSPGGAAKVAVLSSGLMGSLSGSAVANTATTGTFTIPLMRSAGFKPETAAGIEAAASSGGALVPPIMGAGAYMMLEIIEPQVTYLEIIQAALIPAILYYVALLLIVHYQAKKVGSMATQADPDIRLKLPAAMVFAGAFATLILFLLLGYTPFRAVTLSLGVILLISLFSTETRVSWAGIRDAMSEAAHGGVSLVAAAACVGIIIGIVVLTGIGNKFPAAILPLAQDNLLAALFLLMIATIILGMGLPSAVCYLLMATLVGPVLGEMGLVPLSAHLFIFYFGMMSMVTPPVALAAYTAAAIARAGIMQTGFAAFRFALIGFVLPYAFVLRPELLMLSESGPADWTTITVNFGLTLVGVVALAGGITGYWSVPLKGWMRVVLFGAAAVLLLSTSNEAQFWVQGGAILTVAGIGYYQGKSKKVKGKR